MREHTLCTFFRWESTHCIPSFDERADKTYLLLMRSIIFLLFVRENSIAYYLIIEWTICTYFWWWSEQYVPAFDDGADNIYLLLMMEWMICAYLDDEVDNNYFLLMREEQICTVFCWAIKLHVCVFYIRVNQTPDYWVLVQWCLCLHVTNNTKTKHLLASC